MRIGKYEVLLELARGGMAEVFVAVPDGGQAPCVVKRLLRGHAQNPAVVRRFHREAELARRLDHPNIAHLLDASLDDQELYLALEWVPGQTLEALLERLFERGERCPVDVAIAILIQLLDALAYAHDLTDEHGRPLELVHRDLTPRNVLVSYRGVVKIIDFGVARAEVDDFRTEPGVLIGTLQYFSPEQSAGRPVDRRSDLYTVAAVGFEMLAGRPLVYGASPLELLSRIYAGEIPRLADIAPDVPEWLERIIVKGLARDPDDRFQTAAELRGALLEGEGTLTISRERLVEGLMRRLHPGEATEVARAVGDAARARESSAAITRKSSSPAPRARRSPPIEDTTETHDGSDTAVLGTKTLARPELPDTAVLSNGTVVVKERLLTPGLAVLLVVVVVVAAVLAEQLFVHVVDAPPVVITTVPSTEEGAPAEARATPRVEATAAPRARETEAAVHTSEDAPSTAERTPAETSRTEPKDERTPARTRPRPSPSRRGGDEPRGTAKRSWATLEAKLARLRASPEDAELFDDLHRGIGDLAGSLGPVERGRVQAMIDAAERTRDVEGLARGLERLVSYLRANAPSPSSATETP